MLGELACALNPCPPRALVEPGGRHIVLFDLQLTDSDGWVVVAPIGELDLANVPVVRQAVVARVSRGDRDFVLDLGGVDFLDSTGLGLVVALAKRIRAHGGTLRVAQPSDAVWSLFELTGLDGVWVRHDSIDAAVSAQRDAPVPSGDGGAVRAERVRAERAADADGTAGDRDARPGGVGRSDDPGGGGGRRG